MRFCLAMMPAMFSFLDHPRKVLFCLFLFSAPKAESSLSFYTYLKLEFPKALVPKASSKTSCLTGSELILYLFGTFEHHSLLPSLPAIRVLLDISFTPQNLAWAKGSVEV